MTDSPGVTLCIINYNGAGHLRRAFEALLAQRWVFAEVLLVDNASDDDSLDVARDLCPGVRIIRLERNLGPARARNDGFRAAACDLILFQDNDVCLCEGSARSLVEHLQREPDALLVAPRVLYAHDPEVVQYDSADCHFLGLMAPRNVDARSSRLDDAPGETTSVISACFLINRRLWQGDPFDESFIFNLEDHDFGVRAGLLGHSLRIEPRAVVLHGSGTPGLSWRPGLIPAEQRLYFLTVNRWIVIAKCYAVRTVIVLLPALLLYEAMQLGWFLATGRISIWRRAVSDGWRARHRVRRQRSAIQRQRKKSDAQVLRDGPLPLTAAVRGSVLSSYLVSAADFAVRGYWRLARRLIR